MTGDRQLIIKTEDDVRKFLLQPGNSPADLCGVANSLIQTNHYFLALALYNKAYSLDPEDDNVLGCFMDLLCKLNRHRDAFDLLIHAISNIKDTSERRKWLVTLNNLRPNNAEWIRRLVNLTEEQNLSFLRMVDLKQYCVENQIECRQLRAEQLLKLPKVASFPAMRFDNYDGYYEARPVYLAELNDVIVSHHSHAVFTSDYAIRDEFGYLHRDDFVLNCDRDRLVHYVPQIRSFADKGLVYPTNVTHEVEKLVLNLIGSNTRNYYHWLLEWVPRIIALENIDEEVTLLIHEKMPEQYKQALKLLSGDKYPIDEVATEQCVRLKRSLHVSGWATVPCDVRSDRKPHMKDVYVHPEIVAWMREKTSTIRKKCQPTRKIYLRRAEDALRGFVNEEAVAGKLEALGFEFVMPEKLSFEEQVKTFAEAKIIIGPTGAAFTNIIFCQPEAHVIPITLGEGNDGDYSIFSKLATLANLKVTNFLTNETGADHVYKWFSTFSVDPQAIEQCLRDIDI